MAGLAAGVLVAAGAIVGAGPVVAATSVQGWDADATFQTNIGTGTGTVVYGVGVLPDGDIILGGNFTSFNGTAVPRVVRLNDDGTLDTDTGFNTNIGTGANAYVYGVGVSPDGDIILSGNFTSFNGTPAPRVVRLNNDGTLDTDTGFNTNIGTGANNTAFGVGVLPDGDIILGGNFTSFNGTPAPRVVRLNGDGTLDTDTGFNTSTGTGPGSTVYGVGATPDGDIILVGVFTSFNGTAASRVVRLNGDGTLDTDSGFNTSIGTGTNNIVYGVGVTPDGDVILVGVFTSFNGAAVQGVVRLNDDGTLDADTGFNTGLGTGANNIAAFGVGVLPDGGIILGGNFTSFNGTGAPRVVRLVPVLLVIDPVTDQRSTQDVGVSPVQVVAQLGAGDANPVTYAATGLPPGLSIDPGTGLITGTPTTPGAYTVTVSATRTSTMLVPLDPVDTTFTWTITSGAVDVDASTIAADPVRVLVGESSTITVTLRDSAGDPVGAGGAGRQVTIGTDLGVLTDVVDNGDGTYSAVLTSRDPGLAGLGFTVDGVSGADTVQVRVVAASPTPTLSPSSPAVVPGLPPLDEAAGSGGWLARTGVDGLAAMTLGALAAIITGGILVWRRVIWSMTGRGVVARHVRVGRLHR